MNHKELLTAGEAAALFSLSVNAFRIMLHRYGSKIRRVRLGRRRYYYYRDDLLTLLQEEETS